ncbi:LSU ribosomal protein L6p (L9e) [Candidatus Vidania fulgoroideae]|uniref:50S ribosomal protein L6 n=1 Tax=Candidatus Vidania fulgoroideorum TaxID=881286 RepID=A0A346E0P5_9PROT|nr:LSU ribosomal protein L6p (L9e) [Candidatus Vidania fulgoroideae]WDI79342.1 hypothetical protein ONB79_00565 [Candidatus Vidania fulgoroideae]WDR79245.1 hypothetical protein ONB65_00860 [Candidatus Vidania fulgoroideae]
MSKIGKKGINTKNICKLINDFSLLVKKKKFVIEKPFYFIIKENKIFIRIDKKYRNIKKYRSMWGTFRANLNNLILGCHKKFKKIMKVEGIGYYIKEKYKGLLEINCGYSHFVYVKINKNIKYKIENNIITLRSFDKSILGMVCQTIRKKFKKSPYKKKGIFFLGEKVFLKTKKKK